MTKINSNKEKVNYKITNNKEIINKETNNMTKINREINNKNKLNSRERSIIMGFLIKLHATHVPLKKDRIIKFNEIETNSNETNNSDISSSDTKYRKPGQFRKKCVWCSLTHGHYCDDKCIVYKSLGGVGSDKLLEKCRFLRKKINKDHVKNILILLGESGINTLFSTHN